MAKANDIRARARSIRATAGSLTDPKDVAVVRDYATELERLAAQQEAEDARRKARSLR
jgi:hypothetical protein